MNAEIVNRLQKSIDGEEWPFKPPLGDGHTLYLIVDGNGNAVSWTEVQALWDALLKENTTVLRNMQVTVITMDEVHAPEDVPTVGLVEALRPAGESMLLPHTTPAEALELVQQQSQSQAQRTPAKRRPKASD